MSEDAGRRVCRECKNKFKIAGRPVCPQCGAWNGGEKSGVIKTSIILISTGGTDSVYRSVEEVPGPLRRKLYQSTSGIHSATIVIADREGRKEIAKAIRNLPAGSKVGRTGRRAAGFGTSLNTDLNPRMLRAIGVFLVLLVSILLFLVFQHR